MKLVLLTGDGPEHRYVANRLCRALPVAAVIVDAHERAPSLRRAFRGGIRRGLGRVGLFVFRRLVRDDAAFDAALRRVLGDHDTATFHAHGVSRVDGINSPDALEQVRTLRPDAILVYGTTIVRGPMLALASDLAFNLHTGISPRYRGADCAFWPVVNGEPEWIGATAHECTSAIDGGRIFGTARAEWSEEDGIHELFARAVAAGAELYVSTLQRYLADGRIDGEAQDLGTGREYRSSLRTLGVELRARLALRRGLLLRAVGERNLPPLQEERDERLSSSGVI